MNPTEGLSIELDAAQEEYDAALHEDFETEWDTPPHHHHTDRKIT